MSAMDDEQAELLEEFRTDLENLWKRYFRLLVIAGMERKEAKETMNKVVDPF